MLRTVILAAACLAAPVLAADFSVAPIRVELRGGARSAVVTVANDDARPLRMQLRLMAWTQDDAGKDVYRESEELVYYPRLMTLGPKERRLVRIGVRTPAAAVERSYRLYLDELPAADADILRPAASGVSFSIRFALPVFVAPAQPLARGVIDAIAFKDGRLSVAVRNTGNQNFRIASVRARGGAFAAEAGGWYLLAGAARTHTFDIPAQACNGLQRIEIAVIADTLSLEEGLDVGAGMCPR